MNGFAGLDRRHVFGSTVIKRLQEENSL